MNNQDTEKEVSGTASRIDVPVVKSMEELAQSWVYFLQDMYPELDELELAKDVQNLLDAISVELQRANPGMSTWTFAFPPYDGYKKTIPNETWKAMINGIAFNILRTFDELLLSSCYVKCWALLNPQSDTSFYSSSFLRIKLLEDLKQNFVNFLVQPTNEIFAQLPIPKVVRDDEDY